MCTGSQITVNGHIWNPEKLWSLWEHRQIFFLIAWAGKIWTQKFWCIWYSIIDMIIWQCFSSSELICLLAPSLYTSKTFINKYTSITFVIFVKGWELPNSAQESQGSTGLLVQCKNLTMCCRGVLRVSRYPGGTGVFQRCSGKHVYQGWCIVTWVLTTVQYPGPYLYHLSRS